MQKNETGPLSYTIHKNQLKMDLKSEREKQILYANTYIWNLKKNGSEEPRRRTGIKTQM